MNITSCPRCGGRVRSVSIGWKCESCQGFIDMRGEFHQHKEKPFMPPMTNADHIRAMSDEELAKSRVIDYEEYPGAYLAIDCEKVFYSEEEAIAAELEWLQQPAEEDT